METTNENEKHQVVQNGRKLKQNKVSRTILAPVTKEENSISSGKTKEHYCHFCEESHPFESKTISKRESRKWAIMDRNGQTWEMAAATCRFYTELNEKHNNWVHVEKHGRDCTASHTVWNSY